MIMQLIINSATYKPGIVNISLNATSRRIIFFDKGSTLGTGVFSSSHASYAYYYYGIRGAVR
jgi:hypothetical protein